ncbi:MAG: putative ABC transporter permease [Propionicimonas sp.]|nr:putative ABC transporter permease [Propionicimonas sp.]
MLSASHVVLGFLAYSFLGWVMEGNVRALVERRLVNPGFLTGPFVPIYGIGAVGILAATPGVRGDPALVFAIGVIVSTVVEFVGHLALQRLLGLVLWDYGDRFANLQGRVCLGNSVGFGIAALAVVYLVDPVLTDAITALDPLAAVALAAALSATVLLDWTLSVAAVVRLRPELRSVEGSLARVRHQIEDRLEGLGARYDHRRTRLLARSLRVLTRLESSFPGARTALGRIRPADEPAPAESPEQVPSGAGRRAG